MKAMILAAGLGTRLRPLTDAVPKPMVQLAGRPCMEYTIMLLKKYGVNEIVINLHYLPGAIIDYFGNGSRFGVKIHYSFEEKLMGTAGGFKKLQHFFKDGPALIISGDGLTDLNIRDFYNFHKKQGCIAALVLKKVGSTENYGVVKLREDQTIEIFQEKPKAEQAVSNLANTGIYFFEPEIFDYIPDNSFYDFGRQVFPELIEKNIKMAGYLMDGYWCDIGDLNVYKDAHYDMLTGQVDVEIPGMKISDGVWIGRRISIHPDVKLVGPVLIGDNCIIEKGSQIYGPVVLGKNTILDEESTVKKSILWDNVYIGKAAFLTDSIIGEKVRVEKGDYLVERVLKGKDTGYYVSPLTNNKQHSAS